MDRDERAQLKAEVEELRARLAGAPDVVKSLEENLLATKARLSQAELQRDRMTTALREMREQVEHLRSEVAQLSQPPIGYGLLVDSNDDGTHDVVQSGRKMRVHAAGAVDPSLLVRGAEILLNDGMNIVMARTPETVGDVASVVEVLEDGIRAIVSTRTDDRRVVTLADALRGTHIRTGDTYRIDTRGIFLLEKLPQPEVEDLLLEEVPDVTYADIGGLDQQIEQMADAVELPFLHHDLFAEFSLPAPKGILLYGPPGCGKTLIAKAVANSLARKVAERTGADKGRSYFINIKGPELLNKYVGETERQIRLVFQRAREKSEEGWPVIVFFDEMDSMFRARGSGVSSDMESTIVPQLLAELDGVEGLTNVIVIGATNREDLIDPAILRPGRLDVKIKIDRPDRDAARQVLGRYIDTDTPVAASVVASAGGTNGAVELLIESVLSAMYDETDENRFLEVRYESGDTETLHYRDFASGAMIENIVRRAKKTAIKRSLDGGEHGLVVADLVDAVSKEFHENDDLPNTTNPDDWARISGKKGERIVFIRTLAQDRGAGSRAIERTSSGQYL